METNSIYGRRTIFDDFMDKVGSDNSGTGSGVPSYVKDPYSIGSSSPQISVSRKQPIAANKTISPTLNQSMLSRFSNGMVANRENAKKAIEMGMPGAVAGQEAITKQPTNDFKATALGLGLKSSFAGTGTNGPMSLFNEKNGEVTPDQMGRVGRMMWTGMSANGLRRLDAIGVNPQYDEQVAQANRINAANGLGGTTADRIAYLQRQIPYQMGNDFDGKAQLAGIQSQLAALANQQGLEQKTAESKDRLQSALAGVDAQRYGSDMQFAGQKYGIDAQGGLRQSQIGHIGAQDKLIGSQISGAGIDMDIKRKALAGDPAALAMIGKTSRQDQAYMHAVEGANKLTDEEARNAALQNAWYAREGYTPKATAAIPGSGSLWWKKEPQKASLTWEPPTKKQG